MITLIILAILALGSVLIGGLIGLCAHVRRVRREQATAEAATEVALRHIVYVSGRCSYACREDGHTYVLGCRLDPALPSLPVRHGLGEPCTCPSPTPGSGWHCGAYGGPAGPVTRRRATMPPLTTPTRLAGGRHAGSHRYA